MNVWMRTVAVTSISVTLCAAYLCAAQTGTPPATPPSAAQSTPPSEGTAPAATPPAPVNAPPVNTTTPQPGEVVPLAIPVPPPVKKTGAATAAPVDAAPARANPNVYVIGLLDVLSVRVWGQPQVSGMVSVRDDGMISMQLVGEIKADGLTCDQLKDVITQRLGEFLNNPTVSVDIAKNNSKKYIIAGTGANHPGSFPLNGKVTIFEAITSSGGISTFGNKKKIYLLRGKDKHKFNYNDALQGKNPEQNIEIQNGDIIVIPE